MSLFVSAFLVAMSCQEKGMQEVRALLENNIFSPPKAKKPETKVEKKEDEPKPANLLLVTGFVLNAAEGRYEVVVEDKKKKESRFCAAGETVEGRTILSVDHNRMVVREGDAQRELGVGQALVDGASSASAEEKGPESDSQKVQEARRRLREKLGKKAIEEEP